MRKNVANIITFLGLLLTIYFIFLLVKKSENILLLIFVALLIGLTDFLDGKTARMLNIKSNFGGAFDRIRDKIFTCSAFFLLLNFYVPTNISYFLAISTIFFVSALVVIEVLLLLTWIIEVSKKISVDAIGSGKIKMFLQFFIIIAWLICILTEKYFLFPVSYYVLPVINILLFVTVYFGIKSLLGHYKRCVE